MTNEEIKNRLEEKYFVVQLTDRNDCDTEYFLGEGLEVIEAEKPKGEKWDLDYLEKFPFYPASFVNNLRCIINPSLDVTLHRIPIKQVVRRINDNSIQLVAGNS